MPRRREFLANGSIYHVLNRFIHHTPYFNTNRDFRHFLDIMFFYLQANPPIRYSLYRLKKDSFTLDFSKKLVTLINYCLMPTHFHLTLKQDKDNGIRTYIQKVSNSFSHYINTRNDSKGPIFEGNFKTVRVETNEQMLHLSRYIHLNPVSSNLVARPEDYEYSSYKMYLGITKSQYIDPSLILDNFSSPEKYKEFVDNQVDYQRSLEKIKYLNME